MDAKILSDGTMYVLLYDIQKQYDGRDRYYMIEGPVDYPYFQPREIVFSEDEYRDSYFERFPEVEMSREGMEVIISFIFDERNSLHGSR